MSKKYSLTPQEPFGFTELERLYDRISHARLEAILADEQTTIHEIDVSSNAFGEFLFVTASRPKTIYAQHSSFGDWDMCARKGIHSSGAKAPFPAEEGIVQRLT